MVLSSHNGKGMTVKELYSAQHSSLLTVDVHKGVGTNCEFSQLANHLNLSLLCTCESKETSQEKACSLEQPQVVTANTALKTS